MACGGEWQNDRTAPNRGAKASRWREGRAQNGQFVVLGCIYEVVGTRIIHHIICGFSVGRLRPDNPAPAQQKGSAAS